MAGPNKARWVKVRGKGGGTTTRPLGLKTQMADDALAKYKPIGDNPPKKKKPRRKRKNPKRPKSDG